MQNIEQASLDALTAHFEGEQQTPEAKQAYAAACTDLQAFLTRHQYYGEAAVMVAALTLAQDEESTNQQQEEESK
jgi:hypothetical protein